MEQNEILSLIGDLEQIQERIQEIVRESQPNISNSAIRAECEIKNALHHLENILEYVTNKQ